jgi:hypothetical protein
MVIERYATLTEHTMLSPEWLLIITFNAVSLFEIFVVLVNVVCLIKLFQLKLLTFTKVAFSLSKTTLVRQVDQIIYSGETRLPCEYAKVLGCFSAGSFEVSSSFLLLSCLIQNLESRFEQIRKRYGIEETLLEEREVGTVFHRILELLDTALYAPSFTRCLEVSSF